MGHEQEPPAESAACEVAHGHGEAASGDKTLIAAFASPVAEFLLHFAEDAGYRVVLLEPDPARAASARTTGYEVTGDAAKYLDARADLVVTDHHRPELGVVLRDALYQIARDAEVKRPVALARQNVDVIGLRHRAGVTWVRRIRGG